MILETIITDKTEVITFDEIPFSEKEKVYAYSYTNTSKKYVEMIEKHNGDYYFFKEESSLKQYFSLFNELLGSYLAKRIKLPTVEYKVAVRGGILGIASKDFRSDKRYQFLKLGKDIKYTMFMLDEVLKKCISDSNRKEFMTEYYKLLALDFAMGQQDRAGVNVQIAREKSTGKISLAPVYDYEACFPYGFDKINNPLKDVDEVIPFIKETPEFKEIVFDTFDNDFGEIITDIFDDYSFNKNTSGEDYTRALDFYDFINYKRKCFLKEYGVKR